MRILRAILCFFFSLAAGCGPALKGKGSFKPADLRKSYYSDTCELQDYFSQKPRIYSVVDDFNIEGGGHRRAGRASYQLQPGPQQRAFRRLLGTFYKRLPDLSKGPQKTFKVEADYHVLQGERTLPIGATSIISAGNIAFEIPYHPCIGAFLYGASHYRIREKLLKSGKI